MLLGIPMGWIELFFITLPLLLGVWIFWSGRWRLPIFVAGTVCLSFFLMVAVFNMELHTPPEKRIIYWNGGNSIPVGTDVYCNDVHLGQIPLKILVKEFVAKVPEWTSPPEQRFYDEDAVQNYTWFPWDNFRKERFLEAKELFDSKTQSATLLPAVRRKQLEKYHADCRYWWRLENDKNQLIVQKNSSPFRDIRDSFENVDGYDIS